MIEVSPKRTEIKIHYWKYFLFLLFMLLLGLAAVWIILGTQWGAGNSAAESLRKYLSRFNRFRPGAKAEDNLANALRIHGLEKLDGTPTRYAMLFSATDGAGEPVTSITKANVTLNIGDAVNAAKPMVIDKVTPLNAMKAWNDKASFAAVMDYSGSMFPEDLDAIESNYSTFLNAIGFPFAGTVLKFHSSVDEIIPLSASIADLDAAIKKRIPLGNTALFAGMDRGVESMKGRPHLRFLLLTTDGNNNIPGISLDDVLKNSREAFLSSFVLGFGWLNIDVLKRIANETDGYFVYVPDSADLKTWFPKIAKIVNNVQVIEFSAPFDVGPGNTIDLTVVAGSTTLKRTR
jgi:hypothetical protein